MPTSLTLLFSVAGNELAGSYKVEHSVMKLVKKDVSVNTSKSVCLAGRLLAAVGILTVLAACQTRPEVRTQSAPNLDVARYTTYGFIDKPSTDKAGYKTLTTRYLEEAVSREMASRGYQRSDNPDLLINFNVAEKNKVESRGPAFGVGYGGWGWRRGYGYNVGIGGYDDIHNYTEGSLTVDVVDRASNELVWSGTAVGRLTRKAMDKPQPAIEEAVDTIFDKYPKPESQTAQMH
jgi:hypothetical protein